MRTVSWPREETGFTIPQCPIDHRLTCGRISSGQRGEVDATVLRVPALDPPRSPNEDVEQSQVGQLRHVADALLDSRLLVLVPGQGFAQFFDGTGRAGGE